MIRIDTSEYYLFETFNLFIKKINSFKILKKIKSLVYKLKLSTFIKIHSIILIIHLK